MAKLSGGQLHKWLERHLISPKHHLWIEGNVEGEARLPPLPQPFCHMDWTARLLARPSQTPWTHSTSAQFHSVSAANICTTAHSIFFDRVLFYAGKETEASQDAESFLLFCVNADPFHNPAEMLQLPRQGAGGATKCLRWLQLLFF